MEPHASLFTYDPLLCPRCRIIITHINEIHKHPKTSTICKATKIIKGSYVYLMQDKITNLLKIGYSENPHRRLYEINHGGASEVILLEYFIGSKANELIIHSKFKNVRVKREWFQHDSDIIEYFTNHPRKTSQP